MKRKAKFRREQVVAMRSIKAFVKIVSYCPEVYLGKVFYNYKVEGLQEPDDTVDEKDLRPLTRHEKEGKRG